MTRVVIFSGGGDYTDPWHPFAETSAVVAAVLREDDFEVNVVYEVNDLKKTLHKSDVLVVNAGGGQHAHAKDGALETALAAHRGGILALHVAATLLPDGDFWEDRLGGRWVRGHTMHPARGAMRLVRADHAGGDLPAFIDTVDEAYSWLRVDNGSRVLYRQEHDGEMHAVVWTSETPVARSAYCALGHDVEAYGPPKVRELIVYLARWVGDNPSDPSTTAESRNGPPAEARRRPAGLDPFDIGEVPPGAFSLGGSSRGSTETRQRN